MRDPGSLTRDERATRRHSHSYGSPRDRPPLPRRSSLFTSLSLFLFQTLFNLLASIILSSSASLSSFKTSFKPCDLVRRKSHYAVHLLLIVVTLPFEKSILRIWYCDSYHQQRECFFIVNHRLIPTSSIRILHRIFTTLFADSQFQTQPYVVERLLSF